MTHEVFETNSSSAGGIVMSCANFITSKNYYFFKSLVPKCYKKKMYSNFLPRPCVIYRPDSTQARKTGQ